MLEYLLEVEMDRLETARRIEDERNIVFPETTVIIRDIQKLMGALGVQFGKTVDEKPVTQTGTQRQHVDLYRKLLLRKQLLPQVPLGPAYVPFCGDGDIAVELYADREVWAADIDAHRVETCKKRLNDQSTVVLGDCDGWPFGENGPSFAIADFDSYAYPYDSYRSWKKNAGPLSKCAFFFTDGQRQVIKRQDQARMPDGTKCGFDTLKDKRESYNFYWRRIVLPWFQAECTTEGWILDAVRFYLRRDMLYWGAIISKSTE